MRNGIEIWLDGDRVKQLQAILESISQSKFINFDDRTINTADITGIFSTDDLYDHTQRKNGLWKCQNQAVWHDKGERCSHAPLGEKNAAMARLRAITTCGKCKHGFIEKKDDDGRIKMAICECQKPFEKELEKVL